MLEAKTPGTEPELCGLAFQLLNYLSSIVLTDDIPLLNNAKNLLSRSVPVGKDINHIADSLNTTVYHLEQLFRTHLHTTPRDYLMNLRMQTAAELLSNTNMRIGHIGQRVGYPNQMIFSRAFKRHYGVSPREFREKKKN